MAARERRGAVMTKDADRGVYPPLHGGRVAGALIGGGLGLALALSVVGWAIVHLATPSAMTAWEGRVNQWFVAHRTPRLDALSHVGDYLANTVTCIALLIVMVVVLRVWLGRWRESVVLFAALVGELAIFLAVSAIVNRPRPDVPQLDVAPPTSSFPSGHMGAAVAFYGCLAIIVMRQLRPKWFAATITTVLCLLPIVVGVSRMYRGMHHPTDVLAGVVCGGLWLALVLTVLLPAQHRRAASLTRRPSPDGVPRPASETMKLGPGGVRNGL
jgi:membrane-associated phospholipid phosphatase